MNGSINEAFEKGIKDDAAHDYVIGQFAKARGTGNTQPKVETIDTKIDASKLNKKSSLSRWRARPTKEMLFLCKLLFFVFEMFFYLKFSKLLKYFKIQK